MKLSPRPSTAQRSTLVRTISGLAVSALVLIGVAACGPDIGTETEDAVLKAPTEASPSGEITIWDRDGDLFQVFDTVIEKFNEKYPDIVVNHVAVDIDAKLSPALVAGTDVPDGSFIDDKQVAALSPYLYDLSEVLAPYKDDIVPQKYEVNVVNGTPYGVPWDLDPGLLYYRADILEAAGIDPDSIETYDDLLEASRELQAYDPNIKPIHLEQSPFLGQMWLEMFANQLGTSIADENGELRLDSPEYKKILTWIETVADEGLGTRAEYLTPTDIETLENGTQVFVPWAIWWDFAPQQLLPETAGLWRAMPLPAWEPGGVRSGGMGGSSFAIPKDAKNPELAWLFYEFLVFDEAGYTTVYGPNDLYPGGLNTSIPSYEPALDPENALFEPIEALGGQDLWAVATEAGATIPAIPAIPSWWARAVDYLGNNLQLMMDGQMTAQEVIDQSTADIQSNLVDRQ